MQLKDLDKKIYLKNIQTNASPKWDKTRCQELYFQHKILYVGNFLHGLNYR